MTNRSVCGRGLLLAAVFVAGCGDGGTTAPSPNRAPAVAGAIPDRTVHAGETATLDVSAQFTDPDGGSTVEVAALATGSATVTVTATDPGGLTASQSFGVTVPNREPQPAGAIPDQDVHVGETAPGATAAAAARAGQDLQTLFSRGIPNREGERR